MGVSMSALGKLCQKLSTHVIIPAVNKTITISNRCYTIEQCHMILTNNDHNDHIINLKRNNYSSSLIFSSKFKILINYDRYNKKIFVSLISKNEIINTTSLSTKDCYRNRKELVKRNIPQQYRSDPSTSSVVITFNSSSFIDYRHRGILNFPLRLSVRFRTLGRISNGVLLSLTHRKSLTSIQPFIIIEHTNGKIEITILQVDKKNALSTVTSAQCGKNINNDNWHWLQFEIDQNGIFILNVDDDRRTSQVPSYVVSSWNINALLVGDTRRFNTDIFQPFIGYMSDLVFNDEHLFSSLTTRKEQIQPSSFHSYSQHITIGYRIAFFNLVTIDTQTSYIAFSERESQNKNHGKLDIYFLFRSYVPDGIILYRYAQGLNEYFAIGLRAGILVLFIDFGFGKRQIVSDESTKLSDGKWHEVRVTRLGTDKSIFELIGEKQPDVYSAIAHVTDGVYHVIKIIRKLSVIDLYVDGVKITLTGENKPIYSSDQRIYSTQRQITIGSFKNTSQWNGVIAGLSLNRQSIFDSLGNTLIRSGDVEEVYPNQYLGQFNLTNLSDILIFSTTTSLFTSNNTRSITSILNSTIDTSTIAIADYIHHAEPKTKVNIISPIPIEHRGTLIQWFSHQITRFGIRGLLIGSIIIACFLLFLLFIFIRLHCTNRSTRRKNLSYTYNETNGKTYSHLNQQNKRCSISSSSADRRDSKKHLPRFLRYLHTNETKPTSFRLSTNNNGGDNYRLISSINENKTIPYRNSDCVLNEHCCIHSSLSQPTSSSSTSMYHQVNHLMSSNNDLPLPIPLANHTQSSHSSNTTTTTTLRSLKKDADNSSAQTYSAVYSCDLAANLDIEQDLLQKRSSIKRRSILKNNQSSVIHTKMLFLYVKNLVDCYALQPNNNNNINNEPILLATANENRIQLSHALTGSFHSQLPISSVGSCHDILFSYDSQFLIGLFYEVSTNINPYAVKIWSTDNYTVRTSQHPIKCSVALTSRNSSILYMAGKQKYGRGISLGLLDINSCSLTRELKSDPDTSIGDEIRRIILTKNESYVLVVCTEHTSPYTCFVVFKLEPISIIDNEQILSTTTSESTSNCTMILTRFNCDPNNTFPINDSNNNDNEQILTILHTNQIIIWQLYDGEILVNYDFHHLNLDNKIQQIYSCQMNNNRLLIHMEQGIIHIWDVTPINGQFTLISSISDPLIHSISWLDQRHFLSVDKTGQRIRTWNIHRKDVINELISSLDSIQSLYVHLITNDLNKRQEYLIIGKSINDRNLLIFEYTQPHDESLTPSIS
ncbi:unnamed protein product [Adineta steineri]|uniref:Laminin G domain-containing protein n=1 Tax=Adineta steineri TaxID=433720 RepID=A0A814JL30_9BILA|nr:unnamed protein product [Adineta steineri]